MDHIEIHHFVKEDAQHLVNEMFVFKPNDPINDEYLGTLGWDRFDMFGDDYFYHTRDFLIAEEARSQLGIKILRPDKTPIWKFPSTN